MSPSSATSTPNPVAWHEASSYAAAVRTHLDDLAPEVVEELAGGLEADLLDQAEESPDPLAGRLGDPAAYAAELRAAAGIGIRTAAPRRPGLLAQARAQTADDLAMLRARSWWPQAESVALQLRPVWWVVRAWVAFQLLVAGVLGASQATPASAGGWLLLLVLVVGSVALGRGLWRGRRGRDLLVRAGNVLAVLCLLPVLSAVNHGPQEAYASYSAPYPEGTGSGLVLDGEPVTNVFPYGPDGEPLTGVTLLDQDGDPLAVGTNQLPGEELYDGTGRVRVQVPNWTADGDVVWNTFPMGTALVPSEEFYADYYTRAGTPGSALRPPYRSYDEATAPRPRVPDVLVDPSRSLSSQPSPRASEGPVTTPPPAPQGTAPATSAPATTGPVPVPTP